MTSPPSIKMLSGTLMIFFLSTLNKKSFIPLISCILSSIIFGIINLSSITKEMSRVNIWLTPTIFLGWITLTPYFSKMFFNKFNS